MRAKINIVIEKDDDGYYISSPELGCSPYEGECLEEAMAQIWGDIESHLENLAKKNPSLG